MMTKYIRLMKHKLLIFTFFIGMFVGVLVAVLIISQEHLLF